MQRKDIPATEEEQDCSAAQACRLQQMQLCKVRSLVAKCPSGLLVVQILVQMGYGRERERRACWRRVKARRACCVVTRFDSRSAYIVVCAADGTDGANLQGGPWRKGRRTGWAAVSVAYRCILRSCLSLRTFLRKQVCVMYALSSLSMLTLRILGGIQIMLMKSHGAGSRQQAPQQQQQKAAAALRLLVFLALFSAVVVRLDFGLRPSKRSTERTFVVPELLSPSSKSSQRAVSV
ncbi:hypothetical protein V8E36_004753 [Tilletia maclaganii]